MICFLVDSGVEILVELLSYVQLEKSKNLHTCMLATIQLNTHLQDKNSHKFNHFQVEHRTSSTTSSSLIITRPRTPNLNY